VSFACFGEELLHRRARLLEERLVLLARGLADRLDLRLLRVRQVQLLRELLVVPAEPFAAVVRRGK
jgi:hypothetical protein